MTLNLSNDLTPERISSIYDDLTPEERTEAERLLELLAVKNETIEEWLARRFPKLSLSSFAPHHLTYWEWIDNLTPGISPAPHIECWSRGGGKSTTNELGIARVCDKLTRRYPIVISCKQDKADEMVQNVATLLEAMGIERRLGKYGNARGWRRQQLQAANGFNLSAFGLDTGQRGVKIDQYRPDWIIFDDIDEITDSLDAIIKKEVIIRKNIIPAGSFDLAISFTQNAIHRESIMSKMIDGRADFLLNRNKVEPIPALRGMRVLTEEEYRREEENFFRDNNDEWTQIKSNNRQYFIQFGVPTWQEGQSIETCQKQIANMGLEAFRTECQHEVYTNVPNQRFDNEKLTKVLQEIRAGMHSPLTPIEHRRVLSAYPELLNLYENNSEDAYLHLWEHPSYGEEYIIGVDCSEGLTSEGIADYDCLHIFSANSWAQVGTLRGRWESFEFAQLIDAMGNLYGGADRVLVSVLRNKGESVLSHLIHNHEWEKRIGRDWGGLYYYDEQEILNRVDLTAVGGRKPGMPENVATKPVMVTALSDAIKDDLIILRDEKTVQEGLTYVKLPGGKTGGMSGTNDDTITALYLIAILLTVRYDRRVRRQEKREEDEEDENMEEDYRERGWKPGRRSRR